MKSIRHCKQNSASDTNQSEQTACNCNILNAKPNTKQWKYHKYNLPVSVFDISADAEVWDRKLISLESSEAGKKKTKKIFAII